LHATNRAWKSLVDSSSNWDYFIWVSLETTLDQQIVEELQEQNDGSDLTEDEFYDYENSLKYDWYNLSIKVKIMMQSTRL
jgi:hypothetical protein